MTHPSFWIFVLTLTGLYSSCSGWTVVMGSGTRHVRLYDYGLSWDVAKEECAAVGGSLAKIKEQYIQDEVYKGIPKTSSLWLGGQRTNNQKWAWLETGRVASAGSTSGFLQESLLYNCAYLKVEEVSGERMAYIKGDIRCDKEHLFLCKRSSCNIISEECYFTPFSRHSTWEEAQAECRIDGSSNLASFSALVDSRTPKDRYEQIEVEQLGSGVEPGIYWIGLRYTGWVWHDGTEIIYSSGTELSRRAPNTDLNCLQMRPDGVWAPAGCLNRLHFLCNFDEPDPSYVPEGNNNRDLQGLPWVAIVCGIAGFVLLVFIILFALFCWCKSRQ